MRPDVLSYDGRGRDVKAETPSVLVMKQSQGIPFSEFQNLKAFRKEELGALDQEIIRADD